MPVLGDFEQPLLVRVGAGERAAHVAEELGLEQRLGQRAAVERRRTADRGAASGSGSPGDQLLAGARLAGQQDRAGGPRDRLDQLEHGEHRVAAADDVRELVRQAERPLEQHVLLPQLALLELLAHLHLQLVDVERLAQVVAGAEPHRLDGGLGATRTP